MIQATNNKDQTMKFTTIEIPPRVQKLIHKNRMPPSHAILYSYILKEKKVYDTTEELAARFGGSTRRMKVMLTWLDEFGFIERISMGGDEYQPHRRLIVPVKGKK